MVEWLIVSFWRKDYLTEPYPPVKHNSHWVDASRIRSWLIRPHCLAELRVPLTTEITSPCRIEILFVSGGVFGLWTTRNWARYEEPISWVDKPQGSNKPKSTILGIIATYFCYNDH
ncbi:hypothetical protein GALMADRAFT_1132638 [Galerina marginata CBS 339.88]|uniref:Uncharacterized protein n=1 Tax=Galerina marginata (strain CBS 339.88) TaxID=685588 RepID=A0A067SH22_GALM3|nr:hypothetical protein GALMADRAFT_1132638 [Galerina marginata CBS 339.88]